MTTALAIIYKHPVFVNGVQWNYFRKVGKINILGMVCYREDGSIDYIKIK